MNRTLYILLLAVIALILVSYAALRFGETSVQAPAPVDTTPIEEVPGAATEDPSDDGGAIAPEGA